MSYKVFPQSVEILSSDLNAISGALLQDIYDGVFGLGLCKKYPYGFFNESFEGVFKDPDTLTLKAGAGFQGMDSGEEQPFPLNLPLYLQEQYDLPLNSAGVDPRIDLIVVRNTIEDDPKQERDYLDVNGIKQTSALVVSKSWGTEFNIVTGSEAASPIKPPVPEGWVPICYVTVTPGVGVEDQNAIEDARYIFDDYATAQDIDDLQTQVNTNRDDIDALTNADDIGDGWQENINIVSNPNFTYLLQDWNTTDPTDFRQLENDEAMGGYVGQWNPSDVANIFYTDDMIVPFSLGSKAGLLEFYYSGLGTNITVEISDSSDKIIFPAMALEDTADEDTYLKFSQKMNFPADGSKVKIVFRTSVENNTLRLSAVKLGDSFDGGLATESLDLSILQSPTVDAGYAYLVKPDENNTANNIIQLKNGVSGQSIEFRDAYSKTAFFNVAIEAASGETIDGQEMLIMDVDHCWVTLTWDDTTSSWTTKTPYGADSIAGDTGTGSKSSGGDFSILENGDFASGVDHWSTNNQAYEIERNDDPNSLSGANATWTPSDSNSFYNQTRELSIFRLKTK